MLSETEKNKPCISYPLKIYLCNYCRLLQNNFIVSDKKLYNKNYHYRPGISKTVEKNLSDLALNISQLYKLNKINQEIEQLPLQSLILKFQMQGQNHNQI